MEGEIAAELRVNDGEMLLLGGIGGVDSLHTHVEANNEIVKVQTDAQTIADSQLVCNLYYNLRRENSDRNTGNI